MLFISLFFEFVMMNKDVRSRDFESFQHAVGKVGMKTGAQNSQLALYVIVAFSGHL